MSNQEKSRTDSSDEVTTSVYTLLNQAGTAPMMIACDHAGNSLPPDCAGLGISPRLLDLHIGVDIGAREVSRILAQKFDAAALMAEYSRLYVDLNRFPGDPGQMPIVSDGHPIPGNVDLGQAAIAERLESHFYPYHQKHGEMVDQLKTRYQRPIILSVHSFTPVMNEVKRPWHFGVLWDKDQQLAEGLLDGFRALDGGKLVVGDNMPYHAAEPRGYAINEHAAGKGVEMALIEIRQDLIIDAHGQEWAAQKIFDTVQPLLDHRAI